MKQKLAIFWARRDFRLNDNPALFEAIKYSYSNETEFLPIFILDNGLLEDNNWNIGYPRRLLLSRILSNFSKKFTNFLVFKGNPKDIFQKLQNDFDLQVFINEDIEPFALQRDREVGEILSGKLKIFNDQLTINKQTRSGTGNLYSVFTPFKNAVFGEFVNANVYPTANVGEARLIENESLNIIKNVFQNQIVSYECSNNLQKEIFELIDQPWILKIGDAGEFNLDEFFERKEYLEAETTEEEAIISFNKYTKEKILNYNTIRNDLSLDSIKEGQTSHTSISLKWGLISPRFMIRQVVDHFKLDKSNSQSFPEGINTYISELIWREFYRYILYHYPQSLYLELQKRFQKNINWIDEPIALERFEKWIKGQTGYPLVDAGMHQVKEVGWMHNRMRMVVGSILSKNLGVDWRWGQEYFRAVLLDLDEASNNGGWQWAASTGADPKPIRIFNPDLQTENYDKQGSYREKWLPKDYFEKLTQPVVPHVQARQEALLRYNLLKPGA